MNKKWKAKWVKALRSGDYKQGAGWLWRRGRFCCLGVLRDIAHPRSDLDRGAESLLCDRHLKEFGLTDDQQRELADLNDKGNTFGEIATYIEKNL